MGEGADKKRKAITYDTAFKVNSNIKTGGISNHYLYYVWLAVNRRCYNPKDSGYENYGGRGITVCDEWRNDVVAFFNWSIENGYAKGLSLDRKDNDKGYSPDNCRFTTRFVQQRNRRKNKLFTYLGESKTLAEWAAILDIPYGTLYSRIKVKRMTVEEAFTAEWVAQEKKMPIDESVKFGATVKKTVKAEGRKLLWLISECATLGVIIDPPSLSNKITGKQCFTKVEADAISNVLSIS